MDDKYIKSLTALFRSHSNPANAAVMKKYMKEKFEFFGMQSKQRRTLQNEFIKNNGRPSSDNYEEFVRKIWELDQREFQYFALDYLEKYNKKPSEDFIELLEFLIVTKSWWDTVDLAAAKLAGNYFMLYPEKIHRTTEKWMDSCNIWLQRSALLFQLKYKDRTDTELMSRYIKRLAGSDEFFIKKAIGWILREYSKTDAEFVLNFTEKTDISRFSKNEALKWLNRK